MRAETWKKQLQGHADLKGFCYMKDQSIVHKYNTETRKGHQDANIQLVKFLKFLWNQNVYLCAQKNMLLVPDLSR